jgi:hypothetical protein
LRAQQAGRGGNVKVLERRDSLPGVSAETIAELERLHGAVGNSIALGQRTGMDYALFLHAEDSFASGGRVALQVLGIAGCFVGFCAPNIGGAGQFAYASLVDLRTGKVVWFNVLQAGSQVAGIKFGDIRTPDGAAVMVERLLGRMKPGREVRRAMRVGA